MALAKNAINMKIQLQTKNHVSSTSAMSRRRPLKMGNAKSVQHIQEDKMMEKAVILTYAIQDNLSKRMEHVKTVLSTRPQLIETGSV